MDRIENFITDRVTPYIERHPVRAVIGFFLFIGSLEKGVPMVADPISHLMGQISHFIFF